MSKEFSPDKGWTKKDVRTLAASLPKRVQAVGYETRGDRWHDGTRWWLPRTVSFVVYDPDTRLFKEWYDVEIISGRGESRFGVSATKPRVVRGIYKYRYQPIVYRTILGTEVQATIKDNIAWNSDKYWRRRRIFNIMRQVIIFGERAPGDARGGPVPNIIEQRDYEPVAGSQSSCGPRSWIENRRGIFPNPDLTIFYARNPNGELELEQVARMYGPTSDKASETDAILANAHIPQILGKAEVIQF